MGATRLANPSQHLMHAALLETLDSVVTPDVRRDLLDHALSEVEGGEMPVDVYGFRRFVQGPLKQELERVLGKSLAETVAVELELMGCSIPPTVRPSAGGRLGCSDPLVNPVIPALPVPGAFAARPGPRSHTPVPPRRSSPPVARRSFSPWPGTPIPRGALRPTRPGHAAELEGSRAEAGIAPMTGAPESDPLADLPPLAEPARELRGEPLYSGLARAPHAEAFLAEPFGVEAPTLDARLRPLVVVATRDQALLVTLAEWLGTDAELTVVEDVLELLGQATAPRRVLLVVDCNRPSVRPVAVAALADELPLSVAVLLWTPSADDELALRTVAPECSAWHRCTAAAAAGLARRCVELVS